MNIYRLFGILLVIAMLLLSGCFKLKKVERTFSPPNKLAEVKKGDNYLKAHMENGDVYVFNSWVFDDADSTVSGQAKYYNVYRNSVIDDSVTVSVREIELIETNEITPSEGAKKLMLVTGISAAVTVMCLINVKACFGSCPTYYTSTGDSTDYLQAEAFSASVLPSLEATDIDALKRIKVEDKSVTLRLTNEALETHNIRYSNLLAFDHDTTNQVHVDRQGNFALTSPSALNLTINSSDGRVNSLLSDLDEKFYYSETDSTNLAAREHLEIQLSEPLQKDIQYGLAIAGRQSLLSTYLFYQALSYLGEDAGYVLAMLDRMEGNKSQKVKSMAKILGDIELYGINTDGGKKLIGAFSETGPLATDVQLIRIPDADKFNRFELKLTKGHWRIDQIKLVEIEGDITPKEIEPTVYSMNNEIDSLATERLHDQNTFLTTLPGDEYLLSYKLPENFSNGSFFLKSRGYYLEWMRDEWVKDQNPKEAFKMFLQPEKMLKELAPAYKEIEPEMEKIFWGSKYVEH